MNSKNIKLKQIIDEDFSHYKKPSMVLVFPYCDFKCFDKKENKCHNRNLIKLETKDFQLTEIVNKYKKSFITSAIVLAGLEPLYEHKNTFELVYFLRESGITDDIVIYTGYTEEELYKRDINLEDLGENIIVKYGRYIENQKEYYNEILGVNLVGQNQYAIKY